MEPAPRTTVSSTAATDRRSDAELAALRTRIHGVGHAWCDHAFDAKANLIAWQLYQGSVHTGLEAPPGHLVRESAAYAYGLLVRGGAGDRDRAAKIIRTILPLQETDEQSNAWGVFPYDPKTPVKDWGAHTDHNWGQFVGSSLAMIADHDAKHQSLPADLRAPLLAALRISTLASIRRNVSPKYTNISLLSAGVACAGAKLLGLGQGQSFALEKLTGAAAIVRKEGSFEEYLSPTYYGVDLYALYLIKHFATDARVLALTDELLAFLWNDIHQSWHRPTQQLMGPHSRTYHEDIGSYSTALKYYVHAATGMNPLPERETVHAWDSHIAFFVEPAQIPHLPQLGVVDDGVRTFRFSPMHHEWVGMSVATQVRTGGIALGVASNQRLGDQTRNLIAYWKRPGGGTGCFGENFYDGRKNWQIWNHFRGRISGTTALIGIAIDRFTDPKAKPIYRLTMHSGVTSAERLGDGSYLIRTDDGAGPSVRVRVIGMPERMPAPTLRLERDGDTASVAIDWSHLAYTDWGPGQATAIVALLPPGAACDARWDAQVIDLDDGFTRIEAQVPGCAGLSLLMPPGCA